MLTVLSNYVLDDEAILYRGTEIGWNCQTPAREASNICQLLLDKSKIGNASMTEVNLYIRMSKSSCCRDKLLQRKCIDVACDYAFSTGALQPPIRLFNQAQIICKGRNKHENIQNYQSQLLQKSKSRNRERECVCVSEWMMEVTYTMKTVTRTKLNVRSPKICISMSLIPDRSTSSATCYLATLQQNPK